MGLQSIFKVYYVSTIYKLYKQIVEKRSWTQAPLAHSIAGSPSHFQEICIFWLAYGDPTA